MRPDSDRGVSSVVGVVLLLGIAIIGTGAVVGLGAQAFADTERTATVSQVEHSLTQFDSQAAIVALGESSSQRVNLGSSGDGEFAADEDAGWMRVEHHNATGSDKDETIYNASMGAVTYRNGDVEVGYQGGGVWERRGNGSTMRSPPEFNYRGGTLTLPAIRVASVDQASGRTSAVIRQSDESRQVYPDDPDVDADDEDWNDAGAPYGDGTAYSNPVTSGNVTVTVQSRFYDGWAEFFRTRTAGEVSVDHKRNRASVELVTVDTVGEFEFVEMENGLTARGQAPGHSLTDFNLTLRQNNHFGNHHTTITAESGEHELEINLEADKCEKVDHLSMSMLYENTQTGEEHEWSNDTIPPKTGPVRLECGDDPALIFDITSDQNLTYTGSDEGSDEISFGHEDEDGMPTTFDTDDETTSRHLARHYFARMGSDFTLDADSGTGSPGQGGGSSGSIGVLDYESGEDGSYITYLHVTENGIEVELE